MYYNAVLEHRNLLYIELYCTIIYVICLCVMVYNICYSIGLMQWLTSKTDDGAVNSSNPCRDKKKNNTAVFPV